MQCDGRTGWCPSWGYCRAPPRPTSPVRSTPPTPWGCPWVTRWWEASRWFCNTEGSTFCSCIKKQWQLLILAEINTCISLRIWSTCTVYMYCTFTVQYMYCTCTNILVNVLYMYCKCTPTKRCLETGVLRCTRI